LAPGIDTGARMDRGEAVSCYVAGTGVVRRGRVVVDRWMRLRRAIVFACVVSIVPLTVARAATPTSITLTGAASVYRGQSASFTAQVTPAVYGLTIWFDQSQDGVTWSLMGGDLTESDGSANRGSTVDGSVPLGTRYVRARFDGTADYDASVSPTLTQEILIRQSQITAFAAQSPNWPSILPETDPVRIYAQTVYATPVLERQTADGWDPIDAGSISTGVNTWSTSRDMAALGEGSHVFRARILDTDYVLGTSATITVDVSKGATTPIWMGALSVQAHHSLPGQVSVTGPVGGVQWDGAMTIKSVATNTVLASGDMGFEFTLPAMSLGPHDLLVSYAGNANYEPSSKTFTVTVVPDVVEATNVGLSATSVYPYVDGYRDTVLIRGSRIEPISVGIRIYNSGGSLVKSVSIARGTGGYGYYWNGKTSTGSILAGGTYKVIQTLTDAFGTVRKYTNYVYLSKKRLYYHTAYVTKLGSSITAKGTTGSGRVTLSTTSGYARLYSPSWPTNWAGVGYQFTIPSATVYKYITFQVYARGGFISAPNVIGLQNFATCPYSTAWNEYCFDHRRGLGGSSVYWVSAPGSPTYNRYGRTVRGMVSVHAGTFYIYKARVKVYYATLG
jgi:hypothetical protein